MNNYNDNINIISDILKQGEKTPKDVKIGIEVEHFIVSSSTEESASYFGEFGILGILKELYAFYDSYIFDEENLIGLSRKGANITIEPAAQLEISIDPKAEIKEIISEYNRFIDEITPLLDARGLKLMYKGYLPKSRIDDIDIIPKRRYHYMYEYFTEKYAHNMMKGTASVQIALDYINEEDFGVKFKLLSVLGLLFAFYFDNSPIFEGEKAPSMMRTRIWNNTDKLRCKNVPRALSGNITYSDYASYILNTPPIIIYDDSDNIIYTEGKNLKDIYADKTLSKLQAEHAMGMVFPNIRAKGYLEVRYADCVPPEYMWAYLAVFKGIIYSTILSDKYNEIFKDYSDEAYACLESSLMNEGKNALVKNQNIYDFGLQLCSDAVSECSALTEEEKIYIKPLEKLFKDKKHIYELNI